MHRPAYTTPAPLAWRPGPAPVPPARRLAARLLRRSGAVMRMAARWLTSTPPVRSAAPVPMTLPRLEYHADAGAPEGALYVDGEYVGRLDVRRL